MTRFAPFLLPFAVPTSKILGDSEVFIDVGSMLNLTCEVDNGFEEPAFILWFHGDEVCAKDTLNKRRIKTKKFKKNKNKRRLAQKAEILCSSSV